VKEEKSKTLAVTLFGVSPVPSNFFRRGVPGTRSLDTWAPVLASTQHESYSVKLGYAAWYLFDSVQL